MKQISNSLRTRLKGGYFVPDPGFHAAIDKAMRAAVENVRLKPFAPMPILKPGKDLRKAKKLKWARYYLKQSKGKLAKMYWLGRIDGITKQ